MAVNLNLLNLPLSYTYNPLRNQVFEYLESKCHVAGCHNHFLLLGKKKKRKYFHGKKEELNILQNKKTAICGFQDTKKERKASS